MYFEYVFLNYLTKQNTVVVPGDTTHDDASLESLISYNYEPTEANLLSPPVGGEETIIIEEWSVSLQSR